MATKLKRPISFLLALVVAMVFHFPIGITNGITGIFDFGIPAKAEAETITPTKPTTGNGSPSNPYQIGTKEELYWFANFVNGSTTTCDDGETANTAACAKLTANITVNSNLLSLLTYKETGFVSNSSEFTQWNTIGTNTITYTGTFDGDGHTISGLFVNLSARGNVGLFGSVGEGGNIRNVGVLDSYFCGFQYVGGVCGYNNGGTITSCYSTSKIYGTGSEVGGVCGYFKGNGTIKNCYNEGTVNSVKYNVGGVFGYVCEDRVTITIENCYNTGAVTGEYNVGGVCGNVYHYKADNVDIPNKIINCYNTGAVTATTATEKANVGGVCGYVKAHTDAGRNKAENTIENCYNTGAVTAATTAKPANIGGVCGYVEARTRNDTEIAKNTITNCYYINDSIEAIGTTLVSGVGKNLTDKVEKKTQAAFASGEVCYLLNGSTSTGDLVWGQTLGADGNASPVFHNGSNTVYIGYTTCDESAPIQYANSVLSTTTKPAHNYNNGFCEKCGNYDPAKYSDNNYVYEISNAGQLYWFAALVKGDTSVYGITKAVPSANAILKNDITVNEKVLADDGTLNEVSFRTWTPIGVYNGSNVSYMYNGTFDGDGHTISGLYFDNKDTDCVGLFGGIYSNGIVKNINITDSYFSGGMNVGSVCGYNYQGTIENCSNAGNVNGRQYAGGVCGYNYNAVYDAEKSIIKNCYNTGAVTGGSGEYFGGVCGYNYNSTIESCYNIGKLTGKKAGGVCGLNAGTITGCYYNSDDIEAAIGEVQSGTTPDCIGKSTESFASGEVCYLLNGSTSEGENLVWGQTLDNKNENENDVSPVFYNGSNKVYKGYKTCGASDPMQYANRVLSTTERPDHDYTDNNGFCKVCGSYEPITETDGVYKISNAGQLYWFAALVNGDTTVEGVDAANTAACAKLTANINVNGSSELDDVANCNGTKGKDWIDWTPIGKNSDNKYTGTFDGSNGTGGSYTISGLYFSDTSAEYVGLFGQINSNAGIKNINITDSYFNGKDYVGSVCGYNNWGTIENCSNTGTVTGSNYVGGVCGNNSSSVENCSNTGAVTGTGSWYVGGVCGSNSSSVKNCSNTGAVTSSSCCYVGGVCGNNSGGTIESCYSTGKVTGKDYFGGVCGRNKSGTITGTITYSYYNSDTCDTVTAAVGDAEDTENVIGKSTESFTSGEVCYLLNKSMSTGDLAWGQDLSDENTDTLPVPYNIVKKIVYQYCNSGTTGYANTQKESIHKYVKNGMCGCGAYEPAKDSNNDGYYEINNAGNLYWFASYVNGTLPDDAKKHPSANATLIENITVNAKVLADDGTLNKGSFKAWTPIGSSKNEYTGKFNGDGKTISGLYFNDTNTYDRNTSDVGLFGLVGQGGKVEKVNIIDSYFNGNQRIGGVCGYNKGTIEHCTVESTVSGKSYVGGVCGFSYQTCAKITYCYNTGAVTGSSELVGVVGGICGYNEVGEITYCYNTGKVTGSCQDIGGVCGADKSGTIKYCYNTGEVISGHSNVGGVCGQKNGGTIENCYYDSKVCTGKKAVGNANDTENVTGKDTTAFTGGEVCYLLNGSKSESSEGENLVWGQTLSGKTTDASPVFHNASNTVYYGFVDCNAENESYSNSKLYETKPTHNHDGKNYYCTICNNSMVNIVGFENPQYKVLSEESERTFANVHEIVDGAAQGEESITVAANSGLLTVYFKLDDSFKLVKSYKLEVLDSNRTPVKTVESKYNTIFDKIGMAQLVDTLDAGTYTIRLTLYAENGAEIRIATTADTVTVN